MQDQGKIITADIERLLKNLGFGKDDSQDNTNEQAADTILNSFQSPSWDTDLTALFQDFFVQIYLDSVNESVAQMGLSSEVDPVFHDFANQYAADHTAELVTNLDDSTRDMLRGDLIDMMDQGLTPAEIASGLQDNYAFSPERGMVIARTETGFAWNHAGITTYQTGGAKAVRVYDGDHDPECSQADGEVWTFEYAFAHQLAHPNCVRSFGPEMDDVAPDRGLDGILDEETTAVSTPKRRRK